MPLSDLLAPVQLDRTRQAAPQVFETLRTAIVSLVLPPGTVLSRNELADHFGLSQTPVRDALMRLGEEALVDVFAQHATVVSRIDVTAAVQSHFLRRALELELVRELCGQTADLRQALALQLRQHLAAQEAALQAGRHDAFMQADADFHAAMFHAAGMAELLQLVRRRGGHVERLRRLHLPAPGKAQTVLGDHARLMANLAEGDADAARATLRQHLAGTLTFVEDVRLRHPDWVR